MEQGFADLFCDDFADTSFPSLPGGDYDFENINSDEQCGDGKSCASRENIPTKEDRVLHQEVTGDIKNVSCEEAADISMGDNEIEEDYFRGAGVMSVDTTPEDDYANLDQDSEQGGSVSGEENKGKEKDEDEDEGMGDFLMSVQREFQDGNKEDRIFAEGQPLAPEGPEDPQIRNKEQGASESDEEVCYFGRVPEYGSEMMRRGDATEEDKQERVETKQEDSADSECEDMKTEEGEGDAFTRSFGEVASSQRAGPPEAGLEFLGISQENLKDLIAAVDTEEENVGKMRDFSGEEHQEAGESFADYPSDLSSYEYVENEVHRESFSRSNLLPHVSVLGSNARPDTHPERPLIDLPQLGRAEDSDEDLEMDAERLGGLGLAFGGKRGGINETVEHGDGGEMDESDSCSSSDGQARGSDEEFSDDKSPRDPDDDERLEHTAFHRWGASPSSGWISSDDQRVVASYYARPHAASFHMSQDLDVLTAESRLSEDQLTTEEMPSSDVTRQPAELVDRYSAARRKEGNSPCPSKQGSLDDSFFFNAEQESSGIAELGELGYDERREETNWEQEKERIEAFYKFYNDSDGETGREGRKIKVQFCAEPLSQVIHYKSDSSDMESDSSSTDGEEDLSSTEASEDFGDPEETPQMKPACDPWTTLLPDREPDLSNTQACTRKHKCLSILKGILKMGLVSSLGLLLFWLGLDQMDWLNSFDFLCG